MEITSSPQQPISFNPNYSAFVKGGGGNQDTQITTAEAFIAKYDIATGFILKSADGQLSSAELIKANPNLLKDFISLGANEQKKVLKTMDDDAKATLSYMMAITTNALRRGSSDAHEGLASRLSEFVNLEADAVEPTITTTTRDEVGREYTINTSKYHFQLIGSGETRTIYFC